MDENEHSCQTLIVGGGCAGLTCALKLREAGEPFVLLSKDIGGRIRYLDEYDMNFGAVFFMQGYRHAKELLVPGKLVLPSLFDLECHLQLGRGYGVLSRPVIGAAPQLLGFLNYLKKTFQPRYEAFKLTCETVEMTEAIERDPYIKGLFETSAEQFIQDEGFPKAARALVSQFVHACTGSRIGTLNALDYLNCAMGIIDASTRFRFDAEEVRAQLSCEKGRVVDGEVARIERGERRRWAAIDAEGRRWEADNLVLATPADVAQRLLGEACGPYEIRKASELHAYKVEGTIKQDYAGHALHLFDESIPLINIAARDDGAYEVFTCTPLDMDIFFEDYEVLHREDWPQALFTNPSIVLEQDLGEGLYRIGDHNALGLEPAAISGVFAANRILGVRA